MIRGYPKRIFGALAVVSADNLGSLALGGFKGSCSAIRMCRKCMTTKTESQKQVTNSFVISDVIVVFYSFSRNFSSFEMKLTINFIALK